MTVFTKMINTVPNGVVLSDPVVVRPRILREGAIDLDSAGGLVYEGLIFASGPSSRPSQVTYTYKNGNTVVGGTKTSQTGGKLHAPS